MPFDPTKPAANAPLVSQEMRDQLNALNDKIDAVPAGPPGPPGEVTAAQLDAALFNCAANPLTIFPLSMAVSDPPTQAEVQALAQKLDDLLAAIRKT